MYGAIIGDIVGSRFEFWPHKSKDFELFKGKGSRNTFYEPSGNYFTDDSVMTCAVAKAILEERPFKDTMLELGRKYRNCGFGKMFHAWLDNPYPYGSIGNGSAMRVSPCAWINGSLAKIVWLAEESAMPSHNSIEGREAAICVATCIWLARNGSDKKSIEKIVGQYYALPKLNELTDYKFKVTAHESVPHAIECFLESDNFEDAVRNAVSLGGDSDTQAAIAGSIAEAFYGIPDWMIEKANEYLPDDLREIAMIFHDKYCTSSAAEGA